MDNAVEINYEELEELIDALIDEAGNKATCFEWGESAGKGLEEARESMLKFFRMRMQYYASLQDRIDELEKQVHMNEQALMYWE